MCFTLLFCSQNGVKGQKCILSPSSRRCTNFLNFLTNTSHFAQGFSSPSASSVYIQKGWKLPAAQSPAERCSSSYFCTTRKFYWIICSLPCSLYLPLPLPCSLCIESVAGQALKMSDKLQQFSLIWEVQWFLTCLNSPNRSLISSPLAAAIFLHSQQTKQTAETFFCLCVNLCLSLLNKPVTGRPPAVDSAHRHLKHTSYTTDYVLPLCFTAAVRPKLSSFTWEQKVALNNLRISDSFLYFCCF